MMLGEAATRELEGAEVGLFGQCWEDLESAR